MSWDFDIGAFQSQGFTLTVVAGVSPQSAPITSAFSEPLAVKVTARDPVEPVAGGTISLAAPASGASAKLSAGTATVGSTGVASVTATANAVPGSDSVTAAGVLYSAAQFQLTDQAPAPNPYAMTSSNWSGYAAATDLSQPQANSVTKVTGSWIVPTVTGPSNGTTYSAVWVGIDGFRDNTVEQLGTGQDVSNGQAVYYAWWEMYSSGLGRPEQRITSMTVEPGDSITTSVRYMTSDAYQGQFHLSIVDSSRSSDSCSLYASPAAQRRCAEWIVEAPSVRGSIAAPANFGNVTFTNASAVINGISGPINDSQWQSSAIDIGSSGARQDVTSVLTSSGTTFVVTYNTSAGAAALANANAVLGTAPGGGATTTRLSPPQSKKWIPHGRQASAWTSASSRLRFSTLIARPNAVGSTLPGIGKDAWPPSSIGTR